MNILTKLITCNCVDICPYDIGIITFSIMEVNISVINFGRSVIHFKHVVSFGRFLEQFYPQKRVIEDK